MNDEVIDLATSELARLMTRFHTLVPLFRDAGAVDGHEAVRHHIKADYSSLWDFASNRWAMTLRSYHIDDFPAEAQHALAGAYFLAFGLSRGGIDVRA